MRVPLFTVRSYYSLLRGAVSPARLVERAAELGYGAVALADINSLAGGPEFWHAAQQVGVIPLLGVEVLTDSERVTLIAQNTTGYYHLCRIVSAQQLDPNFDLCEQLAVYRRGVFVVCNQICLLRRLAKIIRKGWLFAHAQVFSNQGPGVRGQWLKKVLPLACNTVNILNAQDIE
ncbi:PHP domain-containing protein, partial [Planctomycetota bacterium]